MSPARENNPRVQGCRERVAPLRLQTECRHGSARVAFKRAYPNFNFTTTIYLFNISYRRQIIYSFGLKI